MLQLIWDLEVNCVIVDRDLKVNCVTVDRDLKVNCVTVDMGPGGKLCYS